MGKIKNPNIKFKIWLSEQDGTFFQIHSYGGGLPNYVHGCHKNWGNNWAEKTGDGNN